MSRIDPSVFRNWNDGDIMHESDYEQERQILYTAINDNYDRLVQKYDKTEVDALLNAMKGAGWTSAITIKGNYDLIQNILNTMATDVEVDAVRAALQSQIDAHTDAIADRYTKAETDAIKDDLDNRKADKSNVYTKSEADIRLADKTDVLGDHRGTWLGLRPEDFDGGQQAIDLQNHINSPAAHPAENILFSGGGLSATNARDAVVEVKGLADAAQTAANTAQTAANNAQTVANNAQTTANNALVNGTETVKPKNIYLFDQLANIAPMFGSVVSYTSGTTLLGGGPLSPVNAPFFNDNTWRIPNSVALPANLVIDLGAIRYDIQGFSLMGYWARDQQSTPRDFTIDVSDNNVNWTRYATVTNYSLGTFITKDGGGTLYGRYIRLTVTRGSQNRDSGGYTDVSCFAIYSPAYGRVHQLTRLNPTTKLLEYFDGGSWKKLGGITKAYRSRVNRSLAGSETTGWETVLNITGAGRLTLLRALYGGGTSAPLAQAKVFADGVDILDGFGYTNVSDGSEAWFTCNDAWGLFVDSSSKSSGTTAVSQVPYVPFTSSLQIQMRYKANGTSPGTAAVLMMYELFV
jgi:hypothetical protein